MSIVDDRTTPLEDLPQSRQDEIHYWTHVLGHLENGVITETRAVIDPDTFEVYPELHITSTEGVEIIATVSRDQEQNGPGFLHVCRADDEL